jgi:hypothetical protein
MEQMKMEVGIYRVSEELIGKDFVGAEIAQSNETWSDISGHERLTGAQRDRC